MFESGADGTYLQGYCNLLPVEVGNEWVYAASVTDRYGTPDATEVKLEVLYHLGVYETFDSWVLKRSDDGQYNARYYAGYDGDRCYLGDERGKWLLLIAEKMPLDCKTETGLFTSTPMSYCGVRNINVPAGEFENAELLFGSKHEELGVPLINGWIRDDGYWEYYAPGVGLVYYRHHWKKVEWVFGVPQPVDEGTLEFELTSYEVHRGNR